MIFAELYHESTGWNGKDFKFGDNTFKQYIYEFIMEEAESRDIPQGELLSSLGQVFGAVAEELFDNKTIQLTEKIRQEVKKNLLNRLAD